MSMGDSSEGRDEVVGTDQAVGQALRDHVEPARLFVAAASGGSPVGVGAAMRYRMKVHLYRTEQRPKGQLRWQEVQEIENWLNYYCYEQNLIVAFDTEWWEGAVSCR